MITGRIALNTALAGDHFLVPSLIAAAAVPEEGDGQVESWVQLLKTGSFEHRAFGSFEVDAAMLKALAKNFESFPQGVPGDYDHSFLTKGDSKAAGWVVELSVRGDELWGKVRWTAAAAEAIRLGEYRYISPEFSFDWTDETGESRGPALLAFGLTNRPFLEGMEEVSLTGAPDDGRILLMTPRRTRRADDQGDSTVDRDKLIEVLGLAADATDEQIVAAAAERRTIPEGAVLLTATEHQELQDEAKAGREAKADADARIKEMHLSTWEKEGKLAPAQREVIALAYDQDSEKVIEQMTSLEPTAAFTAKGGDAEGTSAEDGPGDDAPRSDRVMHLARKIQADQDITLTEAIQKADAQISRDHPALRS